MFSAESVSSTLLRPRQRNASTFIDEQGRPKVCVPVCVCVCVCVYVRILIMLLRSKCCISELPLKVGLICTV